MAEGDCLETQSFDRLAIEEEHSGGEGDMNAASRDVTTITPAPAKTGSRKLHRSHSIRRIKQLRSQFYSREVTTSEERPNRHLLKVE